MAKPIKNNNQTKINLKTQIKAVPQERQDLIENTIKQVIKEHGNVLKKLAYE